MPSNFRADKLEETIHTLGIEFDENISWDNEKMIKLLGDHYMSLEPEKYSWGARYVQSLNTVMLCKHLKEAMKSGASNLAESDDYIAETKLNGFRCCKRDVKISCSDGITRTIGEIVDKKLPVSVLSFDEKTNTIEYKPVINWMKNGLKPKADWVKVIYGLQHEFFECTKDHKIFTFNRGYVKAQSITTDDEVSYKYKGLNNTQMQVVMGSFLGDGCISTEKRTKHGIGSNRLIISHSLKQLPYLELLKVCFEPFSRGTKKYISGYNTECYKVVFKPMVDLKHFVDNLYEDIDNNKHIKRRKTITKEFLNKLDWLGIAIWYMDDGYMKGNNEINPNITNHWCRVSLATNKFNEKERGLIKEFFNSKGLNLSFIKNKDNTFVMDFNSESSQVFFKNVSKYIPTYMEYKLPEKYRGQDKINWWEDNELTVKQIKVKGIEVEPLKHFRSYKQKAQQTYDIEVADNHNFYADNILVHNCCLTYSPEVGFEFFSRDESSSNYLNGNFTSKFLFINKGLITEPQDYKGKFNYRFVLDGELLVEGLENEGLSTSINVEDYIQSILGSLPERAKAIQKDGHRLKMVVFDVLYFEKNPAIPASWTPKFEYGEREITPEMTQWVQQHFAKYLKSAEFSGVGRAKKLYQYLYSLKDANENDIRILPFKKRRKLRKLLCDFLSSNSLPFTEVSGEDYYKVSFLEEILRSSGEGIILKNLHAPYISGLRSSRNHRACLKVKQSINNMLSSDENLVEDFDVFITSANPPKSDRIKDMIGALNCSIYIKKEDGTVVEHEIASISGISHEWKKKLTYINPETGAIELNPEYKDRVIPINGLALTASKLKFQHATFKTKGVIEFKAKNPSECTWDEATLKEMTLTRGK